MEEEQENGEDPIKIKKVGINKYVYMAIILIVLVLSLFLVYNKGVVVGGRKACLNSDSRLVEGFKCDVQQNDALKFGFITNTKPKEYLYGGILGTGSMLPFMPNTTTLYYINVTDKIDIKINDIVRFQRNKTDKEGVVHSIMYIYECDNETHYITRGLNNINVDTIPIKREQILQKVYYISMYD